MFPMHHLNKFYQLKKDEKSLRDRHKILDTLLLIFNKKKKIVERWNSYNIISEKCWGSKTYLHIKNILY